MQFLHERSILHRDICLENLVVGDPEIGFSSLKLIDMGSSCRFVNGHSVKEALDGDVYGTHEFVAPEVLGEQRYSEASDIWSIGVVAFTLLSGQLPFYDDNKHLLT